MIPTDIIEAANHHYLRRRSTNDGYSAHRHAPQSEQRNATAGALAYDQRLPGLAGDLCGCETGDRGSVEGWAEELRGTGSGNPDSCSLALPTDARPCQRRPLRRRRAGSLRAHAPGGAAAERYSWFVARGRNAFWLDA